MAIFLASGVCIHREATFIIIIPLNLAVPKQLEDEQTRVCTHSNP